MNIETIINYAGIIVGTILGIVGIVLSVRSIKKKEPTYSIKSVNVISDYVSKYENLTVAYEGHKIENFTVSKILFYNRGRETITRQDIVTINPLRIWSPEYEILDASILQVNKSSNNFELDFEDNNIVNIVFDYLDNNQGAVIQVVHNGLSSDDLVLVGDIKGVHKLVSISNNELYSGTPFSFTSKKIFIPTVLTALIGWFVIIYQDNIYNIFLPVRQLPDYLRWIITVILLPIVVLLGFANFLLFIYVFIFVIELFRFRRALPEGLEKFTE